MVFNMIATLALSLLLKGDNLLKNPTFDKSSDGYEISGSARWEYAGYQDEISTYGISLDSAGTKGSVSQMVPVDPQRGKWITFRFHGRAEEAFSVKNDLLYMQLDFYSKGGTNYLDTARRLIYREVLGDRKDLTINGDFGKAGSAVWRTYEFEELLPLAETDAVKVTVGFDGGNGADKRYSRFFVDDFYLGQRVDSSTGKTDPASVAKPVVVARPDAKGLVALGGRWFYKPVPEEKIEGGRVVVDASNADRLFYNDGRWTNPFLGNMTACLRKGYLDSNGNLVQEDRLVKDNVAIRF